MKKTAAILLCLALALPLGGCAILDPGPPVPRVILPVRPLVAKEENRMPVQLLVALPVTNSAAGTDRILALMNGFEIRALDSARWADPMPVMVQRLLIDSLEGTRRFAAVGPEESFMESSIRLSTELRRFYLRYEGGDSAPTAEIALIFTLTDLGTRTVFARTIISAEHRAAGNSLKEFVAAFATAMVKVLEESREWTVRKVETHVGAADAKTP